MDDLHASGLAAAELVTAHLSGITERPVWQPVGPADRDWLTGQQLGDKGRELGDLLDDVRDRVLPYPMGNGHPRFFGWVNSPPNPAGVLMAPLAAALNPSCAGGDHAGPLLERTVLRWLAELVGYPHLPGAGLLTSGASMATITCLAAARQHAARQDGWDLREEGMAGRAPFVLYVSAEGHSCLRKAAELLGLGRRRIRVVPVDAGLRMDPAGLRAAIEADLTDGLRPFCVAASAGTVNTGGVDPLDAIADVAAEFGLWFHVDGAYGGLGVLDSGARAQFAGLDRADSLVLDPHKWLGVPVDCGCALVRDPSSLREAFSLVPDYLRDESADELGWWSEYGPEQTRPFRALKVWATMSHLGRDGIVRLIEHTTGLAHTLAAMIEDADDFELLATVTTSITAFRYRPAGPAVSGDGAQLNQLNRDLPQAVQRRGRTFITGTRLGNIEALRACFLSPATTNDDLDILLRELRAAVTDLGRQITH